MPNTIMPIERGTAFIRAWAEHEWPIGREQALALRDQIGWVAAEDDEEIFTTNVGLVPGEGDLNFSQGALYQVNFELSSTDFDGPDVRAAAQEAFTQYVDALTQVWGTPEQFTDRGVRTADWTTPNGSRATIRHLNRILSAYVESPEWQVTKAMARLDEIETGDA